MLSFVFFSNIVVVKFQQSAHLFLPDILFYLILFICGCCASGHLAYNDQIASLRRFYSSRDWNEWFHLRDENPTNYFLQVYLWFEYLFKLSLTLQT